MQFLLVNTNSAVRKIFNITAKKAGIELDVVDSIEKIPLDKDYGCIFVDDGVLKTGDIGNFKSKMITTKFCIILSKDSPLVSGFDSYIRKPFLPTDIYDVLKKEKYNEMNNVADDGDKGEDLGESGASEGEINANSDIDLSEFSDSEDEFLSGAKEADEAQNIDFGRNPIDGSVDLNLNETLSSESPKSPEPSAENAAPSDDFEIPTTFDLDSVDLGYLNDSANATADSASQTDLANQSVNADDLANLGADNLPNDLSANSANIEAQSAESIPNTPNLDTNPTIDLATSPDISPNQATANTAPLDIDAIDLVQDSTQDLAQNLSAEQSAQTADLAQPNPAPQAPQTPQSKIFEEAESQIRNIKALADSDGHFYNSSNVQDDIDFSHIMALQDEILKEEEEKKKKSVIGGDIYKPKGGEANPTPQATQTPPPEPDLPSEAQQTPQPTPQADEFADIVPNIAENPANSTENIALDNVADLAQDLPNLQDSAQNDSIDLAQTDLPSADLQNLDSIDLVQDSTLQKADSIDLVQDSAQNVDSPSADLNADSTDMIDLAQPQAQDSIDLVQDSTPQNIDSIDLAQEQNAQDLAQNIPQDSQDAMKDAQGAEDDFLETLDFLKDPAPTQSTTDSIDLSPPIDLAQNATDSLSIDANALDSIPPPAPPPLDLTQDSPPQSTTEQKPNYEEYSFDEMVDSMANDDLDGLDNLKGISDITADSPTPSPHKPNGNNDILNNLEISPQDNIDADYHADSVSAPSPKLDQSENALEHINENNFNVAFSSGISAEMDSISPNFKAQDFIQDLTLGSETALPDFSKSLKQHTTPEQRYNMLGLPIDESGDVKNINDLSKNEIENLDDEALLLLQEKSLHEPKKPPKPKEAPKILDKQQIDDITNILEDTQKPKSTANQPQKPQKLSINNNEFSSLTQEALSEVLGEESLDDDLGEDFTPDIAPKSTNANQSTQKEPTLPKQINLADGNLDIAELLQTFPIDKLRELLSGVQITVNITFPTKKAK